MKVVSSRTQRDLRTLGSHVRAMRKIHNLTMDDLAERAGITRATLASIEQGRGGARIDAVLSVLRILGLNDAVVAATDPFSTDLGRFRAGLADRQRVRTP